VTTSRFPYAIDRTFAAPLRAFGVTSRTAVVVLDDVGLTAHFGLFRTRTRWENVREASVTGPYRWYRAIGPRLSLSDRGVTYGSTADGGVCIAFHRPVAGLFGPARVHPNLTVTVADRDGLVAAITTRLSD
jgi:hypothetical protein